MRYGFYPDLAIHEKKEKREKERMLILKRTIEALDCLSKKVNFSEAFLFGSLTKQYSFTEESDVDIAFYGLSDEDFFYTIAFLSQKIRRDVDIIQLENHPLRDKIYDTGVIKWIQKN